MKNIDNSYFKIQEVDEAMKKTKDKRMYQRYHVIHLYLKGHLNKDISAIVGLCQHTVGTYSNAYKAKGLEGLAMGKSTGTPKFLTAGMEMVEK